MFTKENIETQIFDEVDVLEAHTFQYNLIVWNDDINTFDWVTKALIEICDHEAEQAEQCTLLIHFKGKCVVKNGEYESLKPLCEGITDRGIGATIEELVS